MLANLAQAAKFNNLTLGSNCRQTMGAIGEVKSGAIVRRIVFVWAMLAFNASCGYAFAQDVDLSGKWSLSGQIISGRMFFSFAQICDLKQTGNQIAGPCHGPNAGCSAVGVIDGPNIDLTCRTSNTNAPNLSGVLTFHGAMAPDQIIRGSCTHTRFPGATGVSAMMRI